MSENLFHTVDGFSYSGTQTVPEGTKQEPYHLKAILSPITIAVPAIIHNHESTQLLKTLLDTGGSCTIIQRRALSKGCKPLHCRQMTTNTVAGDISMNSYVVLKDVIMPEFDRSTAVQSVKAFVFDAPNCPHDIIAGRDFLSLIEADFNFSTHTVKAFGYTGVDMKPPMHVLQNAYLTIINEDPIEEIATEIRPFKYNPVDTDEVASNQKHLSTEKQTDLANMLKRDFPKFKIWPFPTLQGFEKNKKTVRNKLKTSKWRNYHRQRHLRKNNTCSHLPQAKPSTI